VRRVFELKKLLRENEVNAFVNECEGAEGFEFIEKVLDYFNASYSAIGREIERIPSEGRVVIIANHTLGLVDGAALLKLVGQVRRDVRIVANDVLMPFRALRSLLLPAEAIRTALDNDEAVIIGGPLRFPHDAKAPLLPVHIGGRSWARFHGLSAFFRFNTTLPIRIGEPIPWKEVASLDLRRAETVRRIRRAAHGTGRVVGFKTETPVAHPEDRLLLRRELQGASLLGRTSDGKQIFLFDAKADSAVLRELGRLREIAFRGVGEGTGKRRDIDAFDAYYRHVVLWDDSDLQIVGAYRIGDASRILEERGPEGLYTHSLFAYGEGLRARFAQSLELGRSFVQPRYQGLRALDYLWQGIGAYLVTRPDVRYLFGPVSLSASYPETARRMLVYFFQRHYGAEGDLASARRPFVVPQAEERELERKFPGDDYSSDLRTLKQHLSASGVSIPALFKQYAELCEAGGTRFLGFNVDPAFANCIDALVLVDLQRVKPAKRERYLGAGRRMVELGAPLLKSA
jgi:putative hemolysin